MPSRRQNATKKPFLEDEEDHVDQNVPRKEGKLFLDSSGESEIDEAESEDHDEPSPSRRLAVKTRTFLEDNEDRAEKSTSRTKQKLFLEMSSGESEVDEVQSEGDDEEPVATKEESNVSDDLKNEFARVYNKYGTQKQRLDWKKRNQDMKCIQCRDTSIDCEDTGGARVQCLGCKNRPGIPCSKVQMVRREILMKRLNISGDTFDELERDYWEGKKKKPRKSGGVDDGEAGLIVDSPEEATALISNKDPSPSKRKQSAVGSETEVKEQRPNKQRRIYRKDDVATTKPAVFKEDSPASAGTRSLEDDVDAVQDDLRSMEISNKDSKRQRRPTEKALYVQNSAKKKNVRKVELSAPRLVAPPSATGLAPLVDYSSTTPSAGSSPEVDENIESMSVTPKRSQTPQGDTRDAQQTISSTPPGPRPRRNLPKNAQSASVEDEAGNLADGIVSASPSPNNDVDEAPFSEPPLTGTDISPTANENVVDPETNFDLPAPLSAMNDEGSPHDDQGAATPSTDVPSTLNQPLEIASLHTPSVSSQSVHVDQGATMSHNTASSVVPFASEQIGEITKPSVTNSDVESAHDDQGGARRAAEQAGEVVEEAEEIAEQAGEIVPVPPSATISDAESVHDAHEAAHSHGTNPVPENKPTPDVIDLDLLKQELDHILPDYRLGRADAESTNAKYRDIVMKVDMILGVLRKELKPWRKA